MARIYFEGFYFGCYVKAEDWYRDGLVYVSVRIYGKSTAFSRPDREKSFLIATENPESLCMYDHTIADYLIGCEESRDASGRLLPMRIYLPGENTQKIRIPDERKETQ